MYVCICRSVSDQDIKEAVANGVDNFAAIQQHLGAATGCGTCTAFTEQVISEALATRLSYAA